MIGKGGINIKIRGLIIAFIVLATILGCVYYLENSGFSNNVQIGENSFTMPYNYEFVKNQTTNDGVSVLITNGERNLSVYRSNGNFSNYQQIENYKKQNPGVKINQTKITIDNNQEVVKTKATIDGKVVVKYYFVKNDTPFCILTYGDKPGTDDDVKGIVNSIK